MRLIGPSGLEQLGCNAAFFGLTQHEEVSRREAFAADVTRGMLELRVAYYVSL